MSRYIRQPGESAFNSVDIDRSANSEWEVVYECKKWTQTYSTTVPRWEIDTQEYNAFRLVVNGYCTPACCQTLWSTNNNASSVCYFGITYTAQYSSPTNIQLNGYGAFGCIYGGYQQPIQYMNNSSTATLELYPSGDNMVTWNANATPRNCWYNNIGVKGLTCQSWDTIDFIELCVAGRSTLEPATKYASWHLYGHRR